MPPSQTALVTGASRGIGNEIALELARHHYRVAVNYYNESPSTVEETVAAAVPRMLTDSSGRMTGNSSLILYQGRLADKPSVGGTVVRS